MSPFLFVLLLMDSTPAVISTAYSYIHMVSVAPVILLIPWLLVLSESNLAVFLQAFILYFKTFEKQSDPCIELDTGVWQHLIVKSKGSRVKTLPFYAETSLEKG